jgi:hypothetical protein
MQPAPEEGGSREEVASLVEELLHEQGPMLLEYLALEVRVISFLLNFGMCHKQMEY